jgi:hypothetical protein
LRVEDSEGPKKIPGEYWLSHDYVKIKKLGE